VEEVSALALQVGVASGNRLALFLPIVRPVFLPREVALGAFQPLAFVRKVRRLDGESVTVSVRVATVRDGDDYVTVVGIVPAERSDVDPVRRLAEDVTHEK
jgi:hypothetical protein